MELNGRLHVVSKDGKQEVEGVLQLFYECLRNITISHFAVKQFFDEYGHEKASLKLLKYHKKWLEEEIRKVKLLIEAGYDLQSYRDDLKELEADYRLVLELIKRLESEVKELSKEEEEEILEEVDDDVVLEEAVLEDAERLDAEMDYFAWQEEFRDERGDVE